MRRAWFLGVFCLCWASLGVAVPAAERHAAFAVDANTGAVLHDEHADELRYPASLTKMMTLYMAFEAIERGRTSYTTRIKVSQEAAAQPPTKLDLDPGETIQLIDAIKSLITKSANDMAVAIAEHLAGSESNFARLMTVKARLLGMTRTTFRNASGLPDPEQVTTARDMVTLALRLHDTFPVHYKLFATRTFSYGGSTYRNHNNLLSNFQGTEGIKTGYTRASGFNLVAAVRRGPRHVIGAVFGGTTSSRRDDAMRLILSRALFKASPVFTRKPAPTLVALAKPAPRPAPSPQPEPRMSQPPPATHSPTPVAVSVPAPKPAQRPRPPATEQPVVSAAPPAPALPHAVPAQSTPAAPEPEPAAFKIDVARVKPVMVPLRTRTAEVDAAPVEPVLRREVSPPAEAPPAQLRPFVASVPAAPAVPVPVPAPAVAPARGVPASTLDAQAARIARPAAAAGGATSVPAPRLVDASTTRSALRGPPPVAEARPAGSGFEIQIGAFATANEAERALANVRSTTGDLLQSRPGRASLVQKDARTLYRARFSGFDSTSAANTCLELRRRQVDCFVMRAE